VGYGDVELVRTPTNPDGGNQMTAVDIMPVAEATALFRKWHRPDIAALYRLAGYYRQLASSPASRSYTGRGSGRFVWRTPCWRVLA
jgi:hypothetical protein